MDPTIASPVMDAEGRHHGARGRKNRWMATKPIVPSLSNLPLLNRRRFTSTRLTLSI